MGFGDQNSGPHACVASVLLTEPSLQFQASILNIGCLHLEGAQNVLSQEYSIFLFKLFLSGLQLSYTDHAPVCLYSIRQVKHLDCFRLVTFGESKSEILFLSKKLNHFFFFLKLCCLIHCTLCSPQPNCARRQIKFHIS